MVKGYRTALLLSKLTRSSLTGNVATKNSLNSIESILGFPEPQGIQGWKQAFAVEGH